MWVAAFLRLGKNITPEVPLSRRWMTRAGSSLPRDLQVAVHRVLDGPLQLVGGALGVEPGRLVHRQEVRVLVEDVRRAVGASSTQRSGSITPRVISSPSLSVREATRTMTSQTAQPPQSMILRISRLGKLGERGPSRRRPGAVPACSGPTTALRIMAGPPAARKRRGNGLAVADPAVPGHRQRFGEGHAHAVDILVVLRARPPPG